MWDKEAAKRVTDVKFEQDKFVELHNFAIGIGLELIDYDDDGYSRFMSFGFTGKVTPQLKLDLK